MSVLSWNARGLGSTRAFRRLSLLVKDQCPDVVFLMETRLPIMAVDRVRVALGFDNGFEVLRKYFGGGLLLLWKATVYFLSFDDKIGSSYYNYSDMENFSHFLDKYCLSTLSFEGDKYTWHKRSVHERLDWALESESWKNLFPNATLYHLPFYGSDHRPLKDSWTNSSRVSSCPNAFNEFLFCQEGCISALKSWNKSNMVMFHSRIQDTQKEIARLQASTSYSSESALRIQNLQSQLDALLYKEEVYWKQRSRVNWLRAGDKNTKFFHRFASHRKKNNTIKYLKDDLGNSTNNPEAMFSIVSSFFTTLFSSEGCDAEATSQILDCLGPPLDESDVEYLASPYTAQEVKKAVFSLSGDRAPGLDGLNAFFYQKNWNTLGASFVNATLDCLNKGIDFSDINTTLVVLIPKKQHANSLKDFRPISLCTTMYKVISKVLANRLKLVLDKIISPFQSALVSGRIIFDNILIAQEIVHTINNRKNGKRGWAALKLDMAKAFDRVEWPFLESLMFHFNFPPSFVSLIMKCISTTNLSFILNGAVYGSLKPSRGLRQGDPLSPYLFILCAEGLSSLFRNRQEAHILNGIAISRHAPAISHLFFADDSLLFCTADRNSCLALQDVFNIYSKASGKAINFSKSSILFSPNTDPNIRALFFQTFNLEDRPFGCKYLGLPQCLSRSKYHSFTFLSDKVASVLRSWSSKCFSRAGKEVLLRAVIQAFPAYAMACFRIPVKICKGIEAAMARFWWGSSGEARKVHWKSWKSLCQSKFRGGLGFRSLVHFNQAMLAKQAWRIFQNPNSLLSLILKARYFPQSSILEAVPGHSPSFSWRSILWGRDLMASGLIWKVGNGSGIKTLGDHWLPNNKFKFFTSNNPPLSSHLLSFFISDSGTWDVGKLQSCFDESMVKDILAVPISGHYGHDKQIWEKESSGCFTIKSAYHLAFSNQDLPSSSSFSDSKKFWKRVWSSPAPPKVKLFIWRLLSNAIPVAFSLFKKCVIDSPLCPICKMENETIQHALLDCSRARKAWRHSRFANYFHTFKTLDIAEFFLGLFNTLDKNDVGILFCFIWALWNQRNNIVYNQYTLPPKEVYDWSLNYFFKFLDAQQQHVTGSQFASNSAQPTQIPPSTRFRIFTDAAIDSVNRKHSIGVVVLDADNAVKAGFSAPFSGLVPPAVAEAKAIFQAIQWAQMISLPVDVLLTDCKSIVDKLSSCNRNNSVLDDVLSNIQNLLSFSPRLAISYVPRENNVLAHKLAKFGLGLDNELIWNGSLPSI
ncbi:uncharacterized protein LOC115696415 [Cannabis sativa]|uniref:uncharacterized protein LOC115696415 n=1 Tax=Cannabis sativa TaxID=3483 RepID=UPI0011DF3F6D|nr:uncharacterized protein LOC115696415 [Cannabis sativa]